VRAFVVLRDGATATAEELIDVARRAKGGHQAPKTVEFVDSIPVTAVGKADKKALRGKFWHGETRQVH
jgi:fatty-acyl-CoA synthase